MKNILAPLLKPFTNSEIIFYSNGRASQILKKEKEKEEKRKDTGENGLYLTLEFISKPQDQLTINRFSEKQVTIQLSSFDLWKNIYESNDDLFVFPPYLWPFLHIAKQLQRPFILGDGFLNFTTVNGDLYCEIEKFQFLLPTFCKQERHPQFFLNDISRIQSQMELAKKYYLEGVPGLLLRRKVKSAIVLEETKDPFYGGYGQSEFLTHWSDYWFPKQYAIGRSYLISGDVNLSEVAKKIFFDLTNLNLKG